MCFVYLSDACRMTTWNTGDIMWFWSTATGLWERWQNPKTWQNLRWQNLSKSQQPRAWAQGISLGRQKPNIWQDQRWQTLVSMTKGVCLWLNPGGSCAKLLLILSKTWYVTGYFFVIVKLSTLKTNNICLMQWNIRILCSEQISSIKSLSIMKSMCAEILNSAL